MTSTTQNGRAVYAHTSGSRYLFYNSNGYWMVGTDYTGTSGWLYNAFDSYCPEAPSPYYWRYWDGSSWQTGAGVALTGAGVEVQCFVGFLTKASLQTALTMWADDRAAALREYGPISGWDVSAITDMSYLFQPLVEVGLQASFDQNWEGMDLSGWDTSSVTDMSRMFKVRRLPPPRVPCARRPPSRFLRTRCLHRPRPRVSPSSHASVF